MRGGFSFRQALTRSTRAAGLSLTACLLFCPPAASQTELPSSVQAGKTPERPAWGTSSTTVYVVASADFFLFEGTEARINASTAMRSCAASSAETCGWLASAHLPSGALIQSVEISACDDDPGQALTFALFAAPKPAGDLMILTPGFGTTGVGQTPGCAVFPLPLTVPKTVDNGGETLFLDVLANSGAGLGLVAFRIDYTLQVSPAPATATFSDVPTTSPQFRFVEALVAAGITAGCGGGNYCPDQPVTRGQMAVFLAAALGLHFPG